MTAQATHAAPTTPDEPTAAGGPALAARTGVILARLLLWAVLALPAAAVVALRAGRPAAARFLSRRVTRTMTRLGPTFIKVGQILGTRRDLLPPVLCDELSLLRDDVPPLDPAASRAAVAGIYPSPDEVFAELDYRAIAAGSVACVYRGRLRDGSPVAVKVRRPGIARVMAADLSLIRRGAAVVARLRAFHGVPVRELVDSLCATVLGQLDFDAEAAALVRMRANLHAMSRVRVPRVCPEVSGPACIVMEYIPDLRMDAPQQCSTVLRRTFAESTLTVMYHMLFVDGLVHCDLHPGNLYFLTTGQVVVLDAGFHKQLSTRMRRLFSEFFLNMAIGRGRRCAEIVIESSLGVDEDADTEGFLADMAALVERSHGLPAKEFSLISFATDMFALQRGYGISASPELVFPLLSLLVIEGTVRELDPQVDFQETAKPVLTRAVFGGSAS